MSLSTIAVCAYYTTYPHALPTRQAQSPFNGLDPSKPELDAVYIGLIQVCAVLQPLPSPLGAQATDRLMIVEADLEALSGCDRSAVEEVNYGTEYLDID